MRHLLFLLLFATTTHTLAQKATGFVMDKETHMPIAGAMVGTHLSKTMSNELGKFEISFIGTGDTLTVARLGYKTFVLALSKTTTRVPVELEVATTALREVRISSSRDAKADSIINRQAYQKQFDYVGPRIKDAITGNASGGRGYGQLIGINPVILIQALTKKSTPEYKFHQILLRDEKAQFIDRKFNRGVVQRITGLKGDTLSAFLLQYRPDYKFAKKAGDYEMSVYIRESFVKFKRGGIVALNPFKADTVVMLKP